MTYDSSQVAFCDTETTGLDPERHHVWEYAVIVDGVEHVWQAQLWDWNAVDPWVVENTGIRDRFDPKAALSALAAAERFADLVKGRHLVGACPWFDSERIHRVLLDWAERGSRYGRPLPWHYHLIDIETLIIGWLAQSERGYDVDGKRLDDISQPFPWDSRELSLLAGVNPDDFAPAHTALTDARWAKACFEAVMGRPT